MSKAAARTRLAVDFTTSSGTIRPLHGVNNGPVNFGGNIDLSPYHTEIAVPHARLHDCHKPNPDVVDVPCIFPVPDADPERPENYTFLKTDDYLQAIVDVGAEIIYRLGTSIENSKRKYHTHPPADYDRWASVCVHIIRHYNDCWANGFKHGIRHWEIWNEPNIGDCMWTGSDEEYFELYGVVARAIKAHDPNLKVGGPGLAGYGGTFRDKFLAYCRDERLPLDFFSWHAYCADPAALAEYAADVRAALDEHGFGAAESHLNEWHYFSADWGTLRADPYYARETFTHINGPTGAAFAASALVLLQDAPLDVANYYTGDTARWGLFDPYGIPNKTYYAFKAFKQLLDTPNRVACRTHEPPPGLTVAAGVAEDGSHATLLLSNFADDGCTVDVQLLDTSWRAAEMFAVDAAHDLDSISSGSLAADSPSLVVECPAQAVRVVRLTK